ncbi:MAG TPA: ABC transporter permease [Bryobacteraceae bacterium]|nr:ABC transporter permease [Bryobacteraceae bacterium]
MHFYGLLLHVYPASFRAEYGEEMRAIFARAREENRGFHVVVFWVATVFEVLSNGLAAHWDVLNQDLRYSARTLARAPGFAFTAVTVAALGIGGATAAYTLIDYVLIRPLPFTEPNRLVNIWETVPSSHLGELELSPPNYRDYRKAATSFSSFGVFAGVAANLTGAGEPQRVLGDAFTSEIFPLLGVHPVLGRVFSAEDLKDSALGTLVLSYSLWQELFGGDRDVLGRKVEIDGIPHTIIGVMPAGFSFPDRDAELWVPLRFAPIDFTDRTNWYLHGVARLKPGISVSQAQAEMTGIAARLARADPKELANIGAHVVRLRDDISPRTRLLLEALMGAALCLLLIACANLANLLLARALARRGELAIRSALGAGPERLARQMLTESLLLSLAGGLLGGLIAYVAVPLFARLVPNALPWGEAPSIDTRVLAFPVLLTLITGIAFGAVPALRAGHGSEDALRDNARSGGGRRERLRSALVIAEIAACVVLLVSSGLLIRALSRIRGRDPGFRPDHALTLRTMLPFPKYDKAETRRTFYNRVLSSARQLPGVTSAAYTSFLPMVMRGGVWHVEIPGRPQDVAHQESASARFVTPDYFVAMGIPFLMGRGIQESDTREKPWVAVVSQSFVDHYWPGENPLGRRFKFNFLDHVVVGVVGNVRVRGLERASEPQVYLSYQQAGDAEWSWYAPKDLVVRSSGNLLALVPALRRIIHDADPEQPIADVQTLNDILEDETGARTVQLRILGIFASAAFFLAAFGIHGLLAFAVSQRTQEIGVRMALGARSSAILGMILKRALILAAAGVVIGTALAFAAGQSMRALLAGVSPADALTFAAAVGLCFAMTLAGSLLPARRATRVDPVIALR